MLTIEDNFEDILAKAQVGHRISLSEVSEKSGLPTQQIQAMKKGEFDEAGLLKIAPALKLDGASLLRLAKKEWYPETADCAQLALFNMPFPMSSYEGMTVNAFAVSIPNSDEVLLFDAGIDPSEIVEFVQQGKKTVQAIFLTHTHRDHVHGLEVLKALNPEAPVYVHEPEALEGANTFKEEKTFEFGGVSIETKLTSGHTEGGTTYVIHGLEQPVAIVGDAIFAGSVGGAPARLERALKNIEDNILTLEADTILCPGHGPLTTVAEERRNNPFFAGK